MQRPPLLIVCLGLFGMDRHRMDRSVQGIGVLREQLESRLLFMLLDRSQGALVCCLAIGLRGADAPRTSLFCRASEPKHETYCDVRPGSVLAL